jgi:hypothetical protein
MRTFLQIIGAMVFEIAAIGAVGFSIFSLAGWVLL